MWRQYDKVPDSRPSGWLPLNVGNGQAELVPHTLLNGAMHLNQLPQPSVSLLQSQHEAMQVTVHSRPKVQMDAPGPVTITPIVPMIHQFRSMPAQQSVQSAPVVRATPAVSHDSCIYEPVEPTTTVNIRSSSLSCNA